MPYDGHTDFLFKNLAQKWTDGHGLKYRILGPSLTVAGHAILISLKFIVVDKHDAIFVWVTHLVITMLDSSLERITHMPRMTCGSLDFVH